MSYIKHRMPYNQIKTPYLREIMDKFQEDNKESSLIFVHKGQSLGPTQCVLANVSQCPNCLCFSDDNYAACPCGAPRVQTIERITFTTTIEDIQNIMNGDDPEIEKGRS